MEWVTDIGEVRTRAARKRGRGGERKRENPKQLEQNEYMDEILTSGQHGGHGGASMG
jgi:hypothetical protein